MCTLRPAPARRSPAHRPRRGRDRLRRRSRRQVGGAGAAQRRPAEGQHRGDPGPAPGLPRLRRCEHTRRRSSSTTPTGSRTLRLLDFLRDIGKHFTVNQMVAKDTVRSRLSAPERSISYTEFSYMLLQALDFLHLFDAFGCRLQLGGSDQWGNITMGVDLVRRVRHAEVWGLTTPLVLQADGSKFGKTEAGTVWLDPRTDESLSALPVLPAHRGRRRRGVPPLLHRPLARGHPRARSGHRTTAGAARGAARAGPQGVHAGARGGGDGPGRAHGRRPVRRGAGPAGRAVDPRCLRRRPLDDLAALAAGRVGDIARRAAGRDRAGQLEEPGPAHRRTGRGLRQRPPGGRRRPVDRAGDLLSDRYLVLRRGKKDYHLVSFE